MLQSESLQEFIEYLLFWIYGVKCRREALDMQLRESS